MELAILGLGLTALLGGIAIWQALPAQRLARRELRAKRSLWISVNGSAATQHLWVLPWQDEEFVMIDLHVLLTNAGDKSVENITVCLKAPSSIYAPEIERKLMGRARLTGMDRVVDRDGDEHSLVTFQIDSIHPGAPVILNDFLILGSPTRRERALDFETADKIAARARYQVIYAWGLSISVSARDMHGSHRDLRLWSLRPGDPFVHDMEDVDGACAMLKAKPAAAFQAEPALVVFPERLQEFPVQAPGGRKIMCASLSRAKIHKGTYFPEIGFLPLHQQIR